MLFRIRDLINLSIFCEHNYKIVGVDVLGDPKAMVKIIIMAVKISSPIFFDLCAFLRVAEDVDPYGKIVKFVFLREVDSIFWKNLLTIFFCVI